MLPKIGLVQRRCLLAGCCLGLALAGLLDLAAAPSPEADRAWQTILEQASGPGNRFQNQEEALSAAHRHLEGQELALANFERSYPDDPRRYSAAIRRASVLAAEARLKHQPSLRGSAEKLLADLEANPATPSSVKADAAYARVSQAMQDASARADTETRAGLLKLTRQFDAAYPNDRRTPNLLTEIATLYDDEPAQKKTLLEEAAGSAIDESVRQRIADDLKRLALLNHPVNFRLTPWPGGVPFELADKRGRVVVLCFWASWSLPAMRELARLEQLAPRFAGQSVDFLTVSLDEDRAALAGTVKAANLAWPVHCDGQGWRGELVRSLGINALPTVWVLDRRGSLLTLNARDKTEELVRQALTEPAANRP